MSVRDDLRNISIMLLKVITEDKENSKKLTDNEYKKLLEVSFIINDISKKALKYK